MVVRKEPIRPKKTTCKLQATTVISLWFQNLIACPDQVVQKLDSTIREINHYPVAKCYWETCALFAG